MRYVDIIVGTPQKVTYYVGSEAQSVQQNLFTLSRPAETGSHFQLIYQFIQYPGKLV